MANQGPPSSLRARRDVTVEPDCSAELAVGVMRCSGVGCFPPLLFVIWLKLEKENGGKNSMHWNLRVSLVFFLVVVVFFFKQSTTGGCEG